MYQQSLVILKPDALQRRLSGQILQRFENAGFKFHAMRIEKVTREKSKLHYAEHVEKAFYPTLEEYIVSGPVLVMVIGGSEAIPKIRLMVGDTVPAKAIPGTIRGDLAHQPTDSPEQGAKKLPLQNLIHASANPRDANTEINLWFSPTEIVEYSLLDDPFHGI